MINESIIDAMVRMARDSMQKAHAPYSGRPVGACVLTSDGTLYGGCSVENASYGLSCCAERVAIFKAIADSKREFDAIAVVADTAEPCIPCGACCQVMAEFKIRDVIMANTKGDIEIADLMDLAPCATGKVHNFHGHHAHEEE
ncbi:MAG: cytidine deaminase [Schwartzia sp.]|nr:cytidine deaminase [Schwartzia sp. (in: firmicutes)]